MANIFLPAQKWGVLSITPHSCTSLLFTHTPYWILEFLFVSGQVNLVL